MAGHSKWHNIKGTKGVADAKRGVLFAKISKELTMATQMGASGDPVFNPYLRVIIAKAKAANMPNDKIDYAIDKGTGKNSGEKMVEKTYEAYGFNGVTLLIDCETDNPNRSLGEIRTIVTREEGKFILDGSISWQFEELGRLVLSIKEKNNVEENIVLPLMSIDGVTDVEFDDEDQKIIILSKKELIRDIAEEIRKNFENKCEIEEFGMIKLAKEHIELNEEEMEKNLELIEKIKEQSDVVNVWDNIR